MEVVFSRTNGSEFYLIKILLFKIIILKLLHFAVIFFKES